MKGLALAIGALTTGCAGLTNALYNAGLSPAAELSRTADAALQQAARCRELGEAQVGYDEELALGGAVTVKWVQTSGGLYLTYPPQSIDELKDPRSVYLPDAPEIALHRYLAAVGKNLGAQSGRPMLEWKFGILNAPGVNALSAPGGYVLVTRGLLQAVKNEDQLAGVLAHEIGHVVSKHALREYQQTKVSQCNVALGGQAIAQVLGTVVFDQEQVRNSFLGMLAGGINLNDTANVDLLSLLTEKTVEAVVSQGFSRDAEFEADAVATELLLSAGYSVSEYADFVGALPDSGGVFAHHPSGLDRKRAILAHAEGVQRQNPFFGPVTSRPPVDNRAQLNVVTAGGP